MAFGSSFFSLYEATGGHAIQTNLTATVVVSVAYICGIGYMVSLSWFRRNRFRLHPSQRYCVGPLPFTRPRAATPSKLTLPPQSLYLLCTKAKSAIWLVSLGFVGTSSNFIPPNAIASGLPSIHKTRSAKWPSVWLAIYSI